VCRKKRGEEGGGGAGGARGARRKRGVKCAGWPLGGTWAEKNNKNNKKQNLKKRKKIETWYGRIEKIVRRYSVRRPKGGWGNCGNEAYENTLRSDTREIGKDT